MEWLFCRRHQGQSGKLKWAGRAWATGALVQSQDYDEALKDARLWGLDLRADDFNSASEMGVWTGNQKAVEAFLAVSTQWRTIASPEGRLIATGLDYASAQAGFDLAGIEVSPDRWMEVRVIEAGALEAMREARS